LPVRRYFERRGAAKPSNKNKMCGGNYE